MKLIAGLGNPGRRYAGSRHNIGYAVVDELARRWQVTVDHYDRHFEGVLGEGTAGGQTVLLLKPTTFMNESGHSVAGVVRYYKLTPADLLVIHDDLDLPVGQLRLRAAGSSGGHKGMDDVIRHLGSDVFPRLRVGIGKVHRDATVEYVLSRFDAQESPIIAATVERAADAAACWLQRGLAAAMNEFNRKPDDPADGGQAPRDGVSEGESS